jgi:hypothetical protein
MVITLWVPLTVIASEPTHASWEFALREIDCGDCENARNALAVKNKTNNIPTRAIGNV